MYKLNDNHSYALGSKLKAGFKRPIPSPFLVVTPLFSNPFTQQYVSLKIPSNRTQLNFFLTGTLQEFLLVDFREMHLSLLLMIPQTNSFQERGNVLGRMFTTPVC